MYYTGLYWAILAILGYTELYWSILGFTGLYQEKVDHKGLYSAIQSYTRLYWSMQATMGYTLSFRAIMSYSGYIGLNWLIQGFTWLYLGIQCFDST